MKDSELYDWIVANPKLATLKESQSYPGFAVAKYKRNVFYDDLWNRQLEECRGAVFDMETKKIVILPFRKIYNYGIDPKSPKFDDAEMCQAFRKVNGFMLGATFVPSLNEIVLSTTGSLDSDFCRYGWDMLLRMVSKEFEGFRSFVRLFPDTTHMFECVHPSDPHIIPETVGLYYLGSRSHSLDASILYLTEINDKARGFLETSGVKLLTPQWTTVGALKEKAMKVDHEGFVFYTSKGAAKIKSPYYLAAKLFARAGNLDRLLNGKAKEFLDEEYYGLIEAVKESRDEFESMPEQERLEWIRRYFGKIYN